MEVIQMLIAKNDEKERSFLFRIVIWTATICSVFPDPVLCKKSDCGDLGVPG